jgi:hypothetical protein
VEIVYEDGTQSKGRLIGHKGNRVVVLQLLENDRIIKPALDHVKLLFEDGYVWQPEFAIPEPVAVVREPEVHNPTIGTNLSVDQARGQLIRLREIIQSEFSDADRSRGLLRKEMLRHFLSKKPTTHDEFRNSFPLQLREKTDSRQMRYLKDIFEVIDEMEA